MWKCPSCSEAVDDSFDAYWKCGRRKPARAAELVAGAIRDLNASAHGRGMLLVTGIGSALARDPLARRMGARCPMEADVYPRCHLPRVKSGNSTGALPFATDTSLNAPAALHAAASYTSISGAVPSRRHCTSR